MYKILIICRQNKIGAHYLQLLTDFFEDHILIDMLTVHDERIALVPEYDMLLITTHTVLDTVMSYINKKTKVLKINKNIDPRGIEAIRSLPIGAEVLVVNVGPKTVSESIYLIYSHGRTDLDLHPYYPGIDYYKKVDYILTQGEREIVPEIGAETIDIYNSIIDAKTYIEIINYFKLDRTYFFKKVFDLQKIRMPQNEGVSLVISERSMFENIINVLFENMKEGVIIFEDSGLVTSCSLSVQKFLKKSIHSIIGHSIEQIIDIEKNLLYGAEREEIVLKIKDTPVICNVLPEFSVGDKTYGLIILKNYSETEMKVHLYKRELKAKGHKSKYKMADIIGECEEMKQLKDYALRIAKSESTVLIVGESGTGKELFAHAIHNNSQRKNAQFVAINCSAIPDELLESELFGYEDGAFTGARRGGKKGLFENANGGTLFLDEVGEIPLRLQNRLLRVLQEREIMRVGGNDIIQTDVRVIAATNVNLKNQVSTGQFRKDLYYRLNVLPLYLPPLRERGDDVLLIFHHLVRKRQESIQLTKQAKDFFTTYAWEGNIRELLNCVEYLINLGEFNVDIGNLPASMLIENVIKPVEKEEQINVANAVMSLEREILYILYNAAKTGKKIGRKQVSQQLLTKDIFMSEQEVRNELLLMQSRGFVKIGRGRGGTVITQKGKALIVD